MRAPLAMVVLAAIAWLMPGQAQALSCVDPRYKLHEYSLLVEATVGTVEGEAVTLAVSRYFKGDGPAELHVLFEGLGWAKMDPPGSRVLIGFTFDKDRQQHAAGPCHLRINATPTNPYEERMWRVVRQRFGDGRPVAPAPSVEAP